MRNLEREQCVDSNERNDIFTDILLTRMIKLFSKITTKVLDTCVYVHILELS